MRQKQEARLGSAEKTVRDIRRAGSPGSRGGPLKALRSAARSVIDAQYLNDISLQKQQSFRRIKL